MIKPEDFMSVCNLLLAQESCGEAVLRSAQSRAYYCLYHVAKRKADELGLVDTTDRKNVGEHARLVNRYKSQSKRLSIIGNMLDGARAARADADYNLQHHYTAMEARKDIAFCKRIIESIESIGAHKAEA